jgi:hypothetical protein
MTPAAPRALLERFEAEPIVLPALRATDDEAAAIEFHRIHDDQLYRRSCNL